MALYAFELGRKKELCGAELLAVLGKENLVEENLDTMIFELKDLKNPQELQDKLGGTIKIIEIFKEFKYEQNGAPVPLPKILDAIGKHLEELFRNGSGKIPFAVSILSFKNVRSTNIKEILNFSKKIIKSLGLNCRFVNKGPINTKPSTIFKARVVEKGIDINVINGKNKLYLGQTVAIQNIDAYTKRDYEKPGRDARVGMLPPKLSQIMINLATKGDSNNNAHADISDNMNASPHKTIYDPFCGLGGILIEGLLMGHDVVGSDISEKMIKESEINCEWLAEKSWVNPRFSQNNGSTKPNFSEKFRVFTQDARFITKDHLPENIDVVVTEGYLGLPQSKLPPQETREIIFRELANLHLNWLNSINPLLKKGTKIVMCVAAFKTPQGIEHLPRFEQIAETAGFKVLQTYSYDRPDQIVVRDIVVLEKK